MIEVTWACSPVTWVSSCSIRWRSTAAWLWNSDRRVANRNSWSRISDATRGSVIRPVSSGGICSEVRPVASALNRTVWAVSMSNWFWNTSNVARASTSLNSSSGCCAFTSWPSLTRICLTVEVSLARSVFLLVSLCTSAGALTPVARGVSAAQAPRPITNAPITPAPITIGRFRRFSSCGSSGPLSSPPKSGVTYCADRTGPRSSFAINRPPQPALRQA